MANEEKELYKFVNDPKYRSKVIAKIHKNSDNAYNKRIKKIEHERDALSKKRTREITRIANDRWESLAGGSIGVNRTEGKIQINNTTVLFSSIRGAEMNMMTGVLAGKPGGRSVVVSHSTGYALFHRGPDCPVLLVL